MHKTHIESLKFQNAITFGSVICFGRIFFSFHITFRDLRVSNCQRRFVPIFLPNSTYFERYGILKFFSLKFIMLQALFPYNGLEKRISG